MRDEDCGFRLKAETPFSIWTEEIQRDRERQAQTLPVENLIPTLDGVGPVVVDEERVERVQVPSRLTSDGGQKHVVYSILTQM